MVFSSVLFLLIFLPATLALHFLARTFFARNLVLLAASLAFYIWGEAVFFPVLLLSITVHWGFGLLIDRESDPGRRKILLSTGIGIILLLLFYFKYAAFFCDRLVLPLGHALGWRVHCLPAPLHLPLGISFFTFQVISYLIDVYRGTITPQPRWYKAALYKSFFPQLIAGPIVRYADVAPAFTRRTLALSDFAEGVTRFVVGLAQKVLIANVVGRVADRAFSPAYGELTAGIAWLGALCYAFQIYFDFNGYSNMAIGMGRMFGFRFLENFDHPYAALSITDFWRRWHISLSSWFRDYLYVPLGGNRISPARTYVNLYVVFVLCGLWHGANETFVVWGLYHGTLLVAERMGRHAGLPPPPGAIRRLYVWLAVIVGWVFFRSASLPEAGRFLSRMVQLGDAGNMWGIQDLLTPELALTLGLAVVFSFPVSAWLRIAANRVPRCGLVDGVEVAGVGALLALSLIRLAGDAFNPFIYFRF